MPQYLNKLLVTLRRAIVPVQQPSVTPREVAQAKQGMARQLAKLAVMLGLGLSMAAAHAQQDLIVVRSMPTASGTTASTITYEISYKNGGPGAANGATIAEQLPNGFQVLSLSCVGAFGGAVCPTTSIANNNPANFPFPRINGTIPTFPEFAVVRLRVQMKLSASPGSYNLSGTIMGPAADPIAGTNEVLSSLYVRPLLLDLTTSHSSTLPAIGGSNGTGGALNAVINGNTIASNIPMSVSYRIENLGPDTAPGGGFHWRVGNDGFGYWVSNAWGQATYGVPVGYESYRSTDTNTGITSVYYSELMITPHTCTAVGSAVCPAPVLYRVGYSGWLNRAPQVNTRTIIGNTQPNNSYDDPFTLEVAAADILEAQQNASPHFGQDLPAGAGLILTATLTNPRYGEYVHRVYDPVLDMSVPTYTPRDGMFTQTDQLTTTRCQANEPEPTYLSSAVRYTDPFGLPLATVSDNNLGNNGFSSDLTTTRTCPQADIVVTAQSSVNGAPASQVRDGDTYAMTYTIANNGPSNVIGVTVNPAVYVGGYQGTAFSPKLNWVGSTRAISCTSSSTVSPCPSQAALDAWMASNEDTAFVTPLANGAEWTIVVSGNAGTTACTTPRTGYHNTSWSGNLLAWGIAMADPAEGNNFAPNGGRFLTFTPQQCPGSPSLFQIGVSKTAVSANTPATAVNVEGYAYYRVTVRNNSNAGITLRNVYFSDEMDILRYDPTGDAAFVDRTLSDEFQSEASGVPGLPIDATVYDPITDLPSILSFNSGIVCTASGGAQCPVGLQGASGSLAAAQVQSYRSFAGTIPLLPPNGSVELLIPWKALPDRNGCTPAETTGRQNRNTAQARANSGTVAVLPDGSEVGASTLTHSDGSANAFTYNNLLTPPCPTGTLSGTLQKTLNGHGAGATSGNTTTYESAVVNGDTLIYNLVLTNTGSLPVNYVYFEDAKATPICRDGISSNPSGVAGQGRCGEAVLTTLTCTQTGSAICPTAPDLAAAVTEANALPGNSIVLEIGAASNYAAPAIPVNGALTFVTTYSVSGLNSFTGTFLNSALFSGTSGSEYIESDPKTVMLNIPQAAGISLSKDVDKLQVGEGEMVTYTIDITNGGNGPLAAGATFRDPLPPGLTAFASATCQGLAGPAALPANGPGVCPTTITNNASGVTATLPAMPANTTLRFTITALAPVGGIITSVGNEAQVTILNGANPVTMLASANFAVPSRKETELAAPMVGVKSVRNATSGGNSVLPNEQLVYTISYANVGGMDIANFQITEALPSYVTYSGGATVTTYGPISSGTINPSFNGTTDTKLLAPDATLGGAGAITITLPVTVNAGVANGTVISNQANASGSGVTGTVSTDNVDNTNPACPTAAPAPCLPTGVTVPGGSVPQSQTPRRDPVRVGVGAPPTDPPNTVFTPVPVPATSPVQLLILALLVMLTAWGVGQSRSVGRRNSGQGGRG